jgi:hypothetical protein
MKGARDGREFALTTRATYRPTLRMTINISYCEEIWTRIRSECQRKQEDFAKARLAKARLVPSRCVPSR